jgi:hypothetical protein
MEFLPERCAGLRSEVSSELSLKQYRPEYFTRTTYLGGILMP